MGNRQWLNRNQFLILVLSVVVIMLLIVGVIIYSNEQYDVLPISPISPLKSQAIEEEFDNLDGNGEIKWYDGFYTWNPTVQATSYPFITGTITINWEDVDTNLMPVSVPYTMANLVIELELRGTKTYTQKMTTEFVLSSVPGVGQFDIQMWEWWAEPGTYNEYILSYWQIDDEKIYIHLVEGGQIVGPSTNFKLFREDLIIPQLYYLPIVMKK
jgi:hypothetical protein